MVDEAHRKGMKVAIHSIGPEDNHRSVRCGVDSIEHGIEIRNEDLHRMRKTGMFLVPTLSVLKFAQELPGMQDKGPFAKVYQLSISTFQRAMKERVKIAFGTAAGAISLEGTNWTPQTQRNSLA